MSKKLSLLPPTAVASDCFLEKFPINGLLTLECTFTLHEHFNKLHYR